MRQLTDAKVVPVTRVGDIVLVGFDKDQYEAALAAAAQSSR